MGYLLQTKLEKNSEMVIVRDLIRFDLIEYFPMVTLLSKILNLKLSFLAQKSSTILFLLPLSILSETDYFSLSQLSLCFYSEDGFFSISKIIVLLIF